MVELLMVQLFPFLVYSEMSDHWFLTLSQASSSEDSEFLLEDKWITLVPLLTPAKIFSLLLHWFKL